MDQANAAQMAARNIKAAKTRRRPLQSNPSVPQSMSFGGGAGGGQGGLFGGSVQAPSSFDFSAPSGGISFPPSSFGGTNAFGAPSSCTSDNGGESGVGGDEERRKKSFRGEPGPATSTPVQSALFGQNQQANPFTSVNGQASNSFSFSQNTSQPSSPGLGGFNSAPTQNKPASSIFSFGGASSQPASPGPSNIFGSTPSQDKPASNLFGFSQPASQPAQQATPTFNFGSSAPPATQDKPANNPFSFSQSSTAAPPATQDKPASNPFSFPQSSTQPSSPGLFGLAPATQAPAGNIFGNPQPSSSGINFGSAPAPEKPSTNMFGTSQPTQSIPSAPSTSTFSHLNAPATPSNSLFGSQQEVPKPAIPSTLFGGQTQQPPTTSNIFDNASQTPAKSNPFGELKTATPSSSLFSNLNKPAEPASNLFGSPKPAPTSNLFGGTTAASTNDLFGNLNKPVDQRTPESKVNGTPVNDTGDAKTGESSTSSLFNKTSSTNVFGGSSSLFSVSTSQAETTKIGSAPTFSFGASQASPSTAQTNGKSSPTFSFGSQQSSGPSAQTNGKSPSSTMKPMDAPSSASQPPPSGMFPNLPPPAPVKSNDASSKTPDSTSLTKTATEPTSKALMNGNVTENIDYNSLYAEMDAASGITDEQMAPLVPVRFSDSQKTEFFTAFRLRSLNKAVEKAFGSVMFGMGISNLIAYYNEKKVEILDRSSLPVPGSKRKTPDDEDQENENRPKRFRHDAAPSSNVFQIQSANPASKRSKPSGDEDQENENPNKRPQQDAPPKSNLFQPRSQTQTARSPEKSARSQTQPQPYLNGSAPKAPSFAPPTASPNAAPLTSPPTKGKRKAEVQLTKDDHDREEQEERRLKTPALKSNSNGDSGGSGGSNTSNIFKSILDSPAKGSSEKKVAPLRGTAPPSNDDAPRGNPFGTLPVPKLPTKPTASPSAATTNMLAFTPTSDVTRNVFSSMPAYNAPNPFQPKPAPNGPSTTAFDSSKPNALQLPTWNTSGVDFLAEFAKDSEEKRMKLAMAEDMDSDEDVDEWKANWKAKEKAKKKEIEDLSKNGKGFVFAGKSSSAASSTSGSSTESPAVGAGSQSTTAPTPFFGQPVQSSGNSVFGSRASTPGAFGSSTGSVLDGHTSGQPILGNIFAHLSDADSGADSGQADEVSPSTSDEEEDSENRDPNYEPGEDSGSGPGTPVEETGVGIASAKKKTSTTPFSFGSSTLSGRLGGGSVSGTSSPGRSLFDRITTDSNGNPVRQVPTEDQENTPPAATTNAFNPFASLNRTPPVPTNQTWNPDTPILFGNTTPTPGPNTNPTNPTVSITEATPTKAATSNLFGNLNNSKSTPKSTFSGSGLFGNNSNAPSSSGSTPGGVGFNFGGQPSATSSLFPSAAASTTTSRATSPGNTTDGDSATEDPDAEKHEQLDLTAGGPGTEDEEIIHEVRAKATKFIPKEGDSASSWKPMGVGPLRLFKHKETGATRLLLRAEPRGTIVLNKALLAKIDYKADNKTVKFLAASDEGKCLETWILQVKTAEMAEVLAEVMVSNKPSE